jgi:AcrR family transcriptional regulator
MLPARTNTMNRKLAKLPSVNADRLAPATRQRLARAVLRTFSDEDFHAADMRSIAQEAGVSFATIYKYFGDKEGLLFEFVGQWLGELAGKVTEDLQGLEAPREKLRKVLFAHLDYYERHPAVGQIVFLTVPGKTWMKSSSFEQRTLTTLLLSVVRDARQLRIIDATVPAHLVLDLLFSMIHRAFTMWIYRGRRDSLTGQMNELFPIFWRGVGGVEAPGARKKPVR